MGNEKVEVEILHGSIGTSFNTGNQSLCQSRTSFDEQNRGELLIIDGLGQENLKNSLKA